MMNKMIDIVEVEKALEACTGMGAKEARLEYLEARIGEQKNLIRRLYNTEADYADIIEAKKTLTKLKQLYRKQM